MALTSLTSLNSLTSPFAKVEFFTFSKARGVFLLFYLFTFLSFLKQEGSFYFFTFLLFYLYKELLEFLYIFECRLNLELRVEVDAYALGMMKVLDTLCIIGSDAATQ